MEKTAHIEGTRGNVTAPSHSERRTLSDLLASLAENFLQVYFLDPYTGVFSSYAGNAFDEDGNRDFSRVNFYEDVADRSGTIVLPEDKPLVDRMYSRENLLSVLESGKPEEFIIRLPTGQANRCMYMKNRIVPYEDSDGSKKLVIGVLDVTEEKLAKNALEEKNAYLEHFIRTFNSAYVVDLKNNTFEIIHMDHAFQEEDVKNALAAGMNGHIAKPIDVPKLLATLAGILKPEKTNEFHPEGKP